MPRLSVVIPAFNAEKFLEKCVRSVLGQSYRDFELILVDDGSSDKTPEMCEAFAAADRRVRVIHQPNAGVSAARNAGIKAAAGDYIAFADADDYLAPFAYERMFSAMDDYGAECVASGYSLAYTDGTVKAEPPPMPAGMHSGEDVIKSLVVPMLCDRISSNLILGAVWRYLFKRSVITDMDIYFSGSYLEDEIFLIKYFCSKPELAVIDDALYYYLQNEFSVTRRYLPDYSSVFLFSLRIKESLVEQFGIPVPNRWKDNTGWAGLLIAVANEFAPGSPKSFGEKRDAVREICRLPEFESAIKHYTPRGMSKNKTVVAALIRRKMYTTISLLYRLKNRNRG